eukprot:757923-Hanusia_phi.AAC.6
MNGPGGHRHAPAQQGGRGEKYRSHGDKRAARVDAGARLQSVRSISPVTETRARDWLQARATTNMRTLFGSVGAKALVQVIRTMRHELLGWSEKVSNYTARNVSLPQVTTPLHTKLYIASRMPTASVGANNLMADSRLCRVFCCMSSPAIRLNVRGFHCLLGRAQQPSCHIRATLAQRIVPRAEKRSFHQDQSTPEEEVRKTFLDKYALWCILSANVVVFCMWQNLSWRRFMAKNFAISTAAVTQEGRWHTIITSVFSHYDWLHLGANMCCLWFFGAETLLILGGRRFLSLYVGRLRALTVAEMAAAGRRSRLECLPGPLAARCSGESPLLALPAWTGSEVRVVGWRRRRVIAISQWRDQCRGGLQHTYISKVRTSWELDTSCTRDGFDNICSRIILIYAIFPVPAAALGLMFLGKVDQTPL